MNALRLLSYLALASAFPFASANGVDARTVSAGHPFMPQLPFGDRVHAAARRPAHVANLDPRSEPTGATPESASYFKITNITAEVHGQFGFASAVNDDGRIAYTEASSSDGLVAFIVNNGGTFGKLAYPRNVPSSSRYSEAFALNENAAVVGTFSYVNVDGLLTGGDIAWSLSGATGSSIAYTGMNLSEAYSINDSDVAVGCDGNCDAALGVPALYSSTGRTIDLRNPRGLKNCYGAATAINNSGQIVGETCGEAVIFSLHDYAKPLPTNPRASGAEAINKQGDIVGYTQVAASQVAFLYRNKKLTKLPFPSGTGGWAVAYGVNTQDEVVGDVACTCGIYTSTAFVYQNGRSYTLNSLLPPRSGWFIADALGINDNGEIVGDGYYNGTLYGISLKPPR